MEEIDYEQQEQQQQQSDSNDPTVSPPNENQQQQQQQPQQQLTNTTTPIIVNNNNNNISSAFNASSGQRKNSFVNAFDILSSNIMNLNKVKRNNVMNLRKYHTLYSSESTTSLNILKFLIESKIKLPTNTNGQITYAEKMKLRREAKDEMEFLLELVKDISYELCLKELSEKILNNVKLLCNAEKASLFFVCQSRECLASFKFDPHVGQQQEDQSERDIGI